MSVVKNFNMHAPLVLKCEVLRESFQSKFWALRRSWFTFVLASRESDQPYVKRQLVVLIAWSKFSSKTFLL